MVLMKNHSKVIRVLLVDDDEDYFILTKDYLSSLEENEFEITWKSNYTQAMEELTKPVYDLCLTDYNLGGKTGIDLIRDASVLGCRIPLILLTGQGDRCLDQKAIDVGADDYLEKEHLSPTLLERSIRYSIERKKLVVKLQDALDRINTLNGMLPICSNCKNVRDDKGYWNKIEEYISTHSKAEFSHSICPECAKVLYPEFYKRIEKNP